MTISTYRLALIRANCLWKDQRATIADALLWEHIARAILSLVEGR